MHRKVQPPTKNGHCVVHACRIYSWTKTNYRRCARYVYLHSAPFRLLMMQHNSYVSSSSIITVMPHDCMAFSYFIRLSVGRRCSLRWTAFSYADDTLIKRIALMHTYIYTRLKYNGDRSPDVPRDALILLLYTLRCISTSSLHGDSFLYRLVFDSFLVMPVFAIGHGCSTTHTQ